MKGKYGTSMGGIEHRPRLHYCRQCEHCAKEHKRNKKLIWCKAKKKCEDRTKPHECKYFKKKWKDAQAGECITYNISDLTEEQRKELRI